MPVWISVTRIDSSRPKFVEFPDTQVIPYYQSGSTTRRASEAAARTRWSGSCTMSSCIVRGSIDVRSWYVYIHAYLYVCIHTLTRSHARAHIHTINDPTWTIPMTKLISLLYTHARTHTCARTHVCIPEACQWRDHSTIVHTRARTYTHIRARTHVCIPEACQWRARLRVAPEPQQPAKVWKNFI